jgi:hypothetical protein
LHSTTNSNPANKCFTDSLEPPTASFNHPKAGSIHIEPNISDFGGHSYTLETKTLPDEPFAEHERKVAVVHEGRMEYTKEQLKEEDKASISQTLSASSITVREVDHGEGNNKKEEKGKTIKKWNIWKKMSKHRDSRIELKKAKETKTKTSNVVGDDTNEEETKKKTVRALKMTVKVAFAFVRVALGIIDMVDLIGI